MKFYLIAIFVSTFSATVYAAPTETNFKPSASSEQNEITPETVGNLINQYVQINSVLAIVSRYPPEVASEMKTNFANLQEKYPVNTNVGAYIANARTLLKNQPALKWFDILERLGIERFEQLVRSKPQLFAPLFHSFERVMTDVTEGSTGSNGATFETETPISEANRTTSPLLTKLRQFVEVNTALANVSRITPEVASEIDSAFADLLKNIPDAENKLLGRALLRLRTVLKNRRSLAWFDFMDKAGVGNLEHVLTSSKQQ